MDPILQAYFSNRRSFVSICPSCKQSYEFSPDCFPRTPRPSVRHECACGRAFSVVPVGLRSCYRKPVNLMGGLRKQTDAGKIQVPCTILDISPRGLQVSTEAIKSVVVNDTVVMTIVLDDKTRSRLTVQCLVRRKMLEGPMMVLGLEITPAVGAHTDILTTYTVGEPNGHTTL